MWILKDKTTYEKYSRELFKTEPNTPYGYYLSGRRALAYTVMPARARRSAVARPMPVEQPVIRTAFETSATDRVR